MADAWVVPKDRVTTGVANTPIVAFAGRLQDKGGSMRASRVNLMLALSAASILGALATSRAQADEPYVGESSWIQPVSYTQAFDPLCEEHPLVRASVVLMQRDDPDSYPYCTDSGGNDAFNFSQFDFDHEPGLDLSLFAPLGYGQRVEARYLGIWEVDDHVNSDPIPFGVGSINTNPPTPFLFNGVNNFISASYDSQLHSGELNYCYDEAPRQTWIVGLRYLNIAEEFHADFDFEGFPAFDADHRINTENHLYGLQVGAEADLYTCRMETIALQGFVKAGVYGAESEHETQVTQVNPPPVPILNNGSDSDSDAAFVGELGLNLNFRMSYNAALVVGYRMMLIDGVALAAEQVDNTGDLAVDPIVTRVDNSGELFYHGTTLGFEYRY
jgi:hypothetical protein